MSCAASLAPERHNLAPEGPEKRPGTSRNYPAAIATWVLVVNLFALVMASSVGTDSPAVSRHLVMVGGMLEPRSVGIFHTEDGQWERGVTLRET